MRAANLANREDTGDCGDGVVVVDRGRASEKTRGNIRGFPSEGATPPYIYVFFDDAEDLGEL